MPRDQVKVWLRGETLFMSCDGVVSKVPVERLDVMVRLLKHRATLAASAGAGASTKPLPHFQHTVDDWLRKPANNLSRGPVYDAVRRQVVKETDEQKRKRVGDLVSDMMAEL